MADPAALCGEPEGRYTLLHDPSDHTLVHHRNIPGTIAYYRDRFGFECLRTWRAPPVYAIVGRNRQAIHFRCAALATTRPNKYADELLDAYLYVEDTDALYAGGSFALPPHCRQ